MKKILALFFILAISAMAFACGGKSGGKTTTSVSTPVQGLIPEITDNIMGTTRPTASTTVTSKITETLPGGATDGTNNTAPSIPGGSTAVR